MSIPCDLCKNELFGMAALYEDAPEPVVFLGVVPAESVKEEQFVICNDCHYKIQKSKAASSSAVASPSSAILVLLLTLLTACAGSVQDLPVRGTVCLDYGEECDVSVASEGGLTYEVIGAPAGPDGVPDCSGNASPYVQYATNMVDAAGGGTVHIPGGCYRMQSRIDVNLGNANAGGTTSSIRFTGDLDATQLVPDLYNQATDTADYMFLVSSSGSTGSYVEFDGISFPDKRVYACPNYPQQGVCPTPSKPAASALVRATGSHSRVHFRNLNTFGLWTTESMFEAEEVDARWEGIGFYSSFDGLAQYGSRAFIWSKKCHSSFITDIDAIDYATLHVGATRWCDSGVCVSYAAGEKHVSGAALAAAIMVWPRAPNLDGDTNPNSDIYIQRVYCDEGSHRCIQVDGSTQYGSGNRAQFIYISDVDISVASLTGAEAIKLENVEFAQLERINSGYTPQDRVALDLVNVGRAVVQFFDVDVPDPTGATRFLADATTQYVHIIESNFSTITSLAQRTDVTSFGVTTTTCNPSPCP